VKSTCPDAGYAGGYGNRAFCCRIRN